MGKALFVLFIAITAFGIGVYFGWDSGVDDGKAMYSCTVNK